MDDPSSFNSQKSSFYKDNNNNLDLDKRSNYTNTSI
jgi:hypothetical protein